MEEEHCRQQLPSQVGSRRGPQHIIVAGNDDDHTTNNSAGRTQIQPDPIIGQQGQNDTNSRVYPSRAVTMVEPSVAATVANQTQARQQMDNFTSDTSQHFAGGQNISAPPQKSNSNANKNQVQENIGPADDTVASFLNNHDEPFDSLEGERDYLLRATDGAILQDKNEDEQSGKSDDEEFVTYQNGKRGATRRRYKGYELCTRRHGDSSSIRSDEGDNMENIDIDQSLQDLREEVEKIQNEEHNSTNNHPSTDDGQMRSDEMGSSSPTVSLSSLFPPNQLRYRTGSADTDAWNNRMSGIFEGLVAGDNEYHPQTRARSFTSPATISLENSPEVSSPRRRTRSHGMDRQGSDYSTSHNSVNVNAEMDENGDDGSRPISSILSSVDAGMHTLRRWLNSRNRSGHPERPMPRQSHAVLELSLGEEDYFLSSTTNRTRGIGSRSYHGSRSVGSIREGSESISSHTRSSSNHYHGTITYPQTIQEEDEPVRQRAFSEPERANRPWRAFSRRRRRNERSQTASRQYQRTVSSDVSIMSSSVSSPSTRPSSHLESGGNSLPSDLISNSDAGSSNDYPNRVSFRFSPDHDHEQGIEMQSSRASSSGINEESGMDRMQYDDPNREARRAWILINQRFQLMLIIVGLLFSFLLFSVLVTWVVLTSAYVVSIDEDCDLPLKLYFWLATIQLILDVFRKDIMKLIFRYESRNDRHEQLPTRVIFYNLAYMTYAMIVLRLGIRIIFLSDGECRHTATKLFNTTRIFVIISVTAWLLLLFGYLVPFFVVAIMLTRNGYSPAAEVNQNGSNFGVFPGVSYSNNRAPPGTIDKLKVVMLEEFQPQYPRECCICMADFATNGTIVVTECEHVFHKRCFQEWLRQARTCPVCRSDIPDSLEMGNEQDMQETEPNHEEGIFSQGPFRSHNFQQELLNLVSILQETGRR